MLVGRCAGALPRRERRARGRRRAVRATPSPSRRPRPIPVPSRGWRLRALVQRAHASAASSPVCPRGSCAVEVLERVVARVAQSLAFAAALPRGAAEYARAAGRVLLDMISYAAGYCTPSVESALESLAPMLTFSQQLQPQIRRLCRSSGVREAERPFRRARSAP